MVHIPRLPVFIFCFTLMASCTSMGSRRASEEAAIPSDVDRVLTGNDNVQSNPSAYLDKNVLVKGEVKQILTSNAFILDYGGGILGIGDKNIIAIRSTTENNQPINLKAKLEVIGIIRLFNLLQMERELGVNLNEEVFKKHENEPVLIAKTILNRPQD